MMTADTAKPADVPSLVYDLLKVWRELEPYTANGEGRRLSVDEARVVDRWRNLFESEISYVGLIRSAVAHSPDVMLAEDLKEVVEVAGKLRDLLYSGLRDPNSVLPVTTGLR